MDGGGDLLSLAFPGQQPLEHADEPGQGSTPFNGAAVLKTTDFEMVCVTSITLYRPR
jgi:hypothetical protein